MSLKTAINLMCKSCIYDSLDVGSWRSQVTLCQANNCPLYEHRPLDQKAQLIAKASRLSAMTPEQRTAQIARSNAAAKRLSQYRGANEQS